MFSEVLDPLTSHPYPWTWQGICFSGLALPHSGTDRLWATTQGREGAGEMGQSHSQGIAKIPSAPILGTRNSPEGYPVWRQIKIRPHPPPPGAIPGFTKPGDRKAAFLQRVQGTGKAGTFVPRGIRQCLLPHPTPLSAQGNRLIPACQELSQF